jgi:hypothetical protein
MGYLHLEQEPYHRQKIRGALQRRGMKPDLEDDWEIHGPHHPELPYQVYVGYAISHGDLSDCPLIVIHPRGVYEIEDRDDWGKTLPGNKIPTIPRAGVTHDER